MSARIPLTFRMFRGDQLLREETLTQPVIKIGKVPSAHLRVDDESVSRMHAILEVDRDGRVHVIDLGSTRGTFINGQKINKARIEDGDVMQIGDVRIEIALGAAQTAAEIKPQAAAPAPLAVAALPPPMSAAPVRVPAVRASAVPMPDTAFGHESSDYIGAKSIEVAAMLGDSVVGVKHCLDPKTGKVTGKTWAIVALGAACMLASAIAFGISVKTAAFNKGGLEYWTRVAHKPAYAYRPQTISAGYDWFAFGGFALGLVTLGLALVRVRDEKKSPYFRIGTAPGVELPLETAPTPSFPLVAPSGDDFVFNYAPGIDGELVLDGKSTPLADLVATGRARPSQEAAGAIEVPIPARAKIRARSGMTTFVVSAVARPRRHVAPLLASLESRTLSYFAGSLAVHLGVWALLQTMPEEASGTQIDLATIDETQIHSASTTNEDTPPPRDVADGDSGGKEGVGAKMVLEEGAAGKPTAERVDGHMRMKDNHVDPQLARTQAIEEARTAGLLGGAPMMAAAFASLTSTGDISSGFDDSNIYGPLFGAEGEGKGAFGYGRSGFGPGGGCGQPPCGLIGTGRYGTIGTGTHAGDGWGAGPGHGLGMRHTPQAPQTIVGHPEGGGDLDKSIIRRYIMRNYNKIQYCYEHELLAHPAISGEVLVQFMISGDGTVQASNGKGFDDNVAGCVAGVIKNIAFPRPSTGGTVQVNYPFTFRAPQL